MKTTETKSAHTPLPWTLRFRSGSATSALIDTKMDNSILEISAATSEGRLDFDANAKLVVRAVNSHAQLVAATDALGELIEAMEGIIGLDDYQQKSLQIGRAMFHQAALALSKSLT